jgi:integrase
VGGQNQGLCGPGQNRTLSELANWYYSTVAPNTLKPNVLENYQGEMARHVLPRIGREKLKNITPQMLDYLFRDLQLSGNLDGSYKLKDIALFDGIKREDFWRRAGVERCSMYNVLRGGTCRRENAELVAAGLGLPLEKVFDDVRPKKGLSGATVNKIKLNLSAIFTAAVKKEIMRRNPCKLVTPPKVDTPPAAFLDEEQSRLLLDALHNQKNRQLEVMVNVFLATGIRAGECTALHWEDIDLQMGLLHVRYTLARYDGQFVRQTPKTEKSKRRIILPQHIVNLLTEHKQRQDDYLKSLGNMSLYCGSVFTNLRGNYIIAANLSRQLQRVMEGTGLLKINLHSLRHTHASLLINSDITAKVIADRLGHSNTKTTLDTYSHVFAASEVKAMQAVEMKLFQNASVTAAE